MEPSPNPEPAEPSAHISHTFEPHETSLPPQDPAQPPIPPTPPVQPLGPFPQQPPVVPSTSAAAAPLHDSPGSYVLQWLTYAFWGWTVLAMSILTSTVIASFVADAETGDFTPYGIAAVLVLLPISVTCDYFYSKIEHQKKTGPASLIMIIHAVLFALFGIGSLIVAVFSTISLFLNTSSDDSTGGQVALYSSLIIFILYAATFLRTLNPAKLPLIRRYFTMFMVVTVGIVAILGIVGPVRQAHASKDDRLIENSLYSVQNGIETYADDNGKLPTSLSDTSPTSTDAKELVSKGIVEYTPNTKSPSSVSSGYYSSSNTLTNRPTDKTYYYKLCVTYKSKHGSSYSSSRALEESDGYSTYVSNYSHPAGRVCYSLKTTVYATSSGSLTD